MKTHIGLGIAFFDSKELKDYSHNIPSISYSSFDDTVKIVIEKNNKVQQINLTPEEAIDSGFINPSVLEKYL